MWSLFVGHLSLEKILKALYVKKNGTTPPYIHDLIKLAKKNYITLTAEQEQLLFEINEFQIETRYPEYKNQLYKKCTEEFTVTYLSHIKELYLWFKSQI